MPKTVIILGMSPLSDGTHMSVNFLMWLAGPQFKTPGPNGSVWAKASQQENAAIQNGTIIEEQGAAVMPINAAFPDIVDACTEQWGLRQTYWNTYKGNGYLTDMYSDPTIAGGVFQQG
jgi:hypothetical protein